MYDLTPAEIDAGYAARLADGTVAAFIAGVAARRAITDKGEARAFDMANRAALRAADAVGRAESAARLTLQSTRPGARIGPAD